jgi:uncharacterized membrane protein YfcA
MEIVFGMIIVLIAGFIQGLTGFGLSIVAIPFLLLLFPLQEIVPSIVVLALLTNSLVLVPARREVQFKQFKLLVVMGILFMPVGVYSLRYLNPDYLQLCFGILITVFSLMLILNKTFPIKREKIGYTIAGAFSGFLNGSLSLSGPPVVLFLSNQGVKKETFRANLTLYFLILNVIAIAIFSAVGMLNAVIFERVLFLAPALVIGVLSGIKASTKIKDKAFRMFVLLMLIISGVWTTISTSIRLIGQG